jgi:chlorophyll/bacteriochlorophyll a synthase
MTRALQLPQISAIAELFKPITWFPPMWAFACGAIGAGAFWARDGWLIFVGMILAGPLVCATSQAVNDWFDRHVDAINEPDRPIPSGRIPGQWGLILAITWTLVSLWVSLSLGSLGFAAAAIGLALAWAYSAPPLRLKRNGWWGNAACGICYEGVAWLTGAAVVNHQVAGNGLFAVDSRGLFLALAYSCAAHGIMTLNDFKSIKGDRLMGVASLPVQLGVNRSAQVAALFMLLPQVAVTLFLIHLGAPFYALAIAVLVAVQCVKLKRFLADPIKQALWYSGFGVPVLVSGMMVSAFAIRGMI